MNEKKKERKTDERKKKKKKEIKKEGIEEKRSEGDRDRAGVLGEKYRRGEDCYLTHNVIIVSQMASMGQFRRGVTHIPYVCLRALSDGRH